MRSRKIQVLVVEDSVVARELLLRILNSDPGIEVIGMARDGAEALALLGAKKPDVITMDIHMPGMDGFQATRRIMETRPVPIVIVTANGNPLDVATSFRAMEAGAVGVVNKPKGLKDPDFSIDSRRLIQIVKTMAEVRVLRRWTRERHASIEERGRNGLKFPPALPPADKAAAIVAIGVSTGGPPVLQKILAALPKTFPAPILIVQHISEGFVPGLVDWLAQTTGFPVHLAAHGEKLLPGHAYIARDDHHMGVDPPGRIILNASEAENGVRPAVSYLFRSVAEVFRERAVGVLLTGMGRDGAEELKLMRGQGSVTIAQDQESSVVFGMPGEAVKIGAATHVLSPEQIVKMLSELVGAPRNGTEIQP